MRKYIRFSGPTSLTKKAVHMYFCAQDGKVALGQSPEFCLMFLMYTRETGYIHTLLSYFL